MTGQNKETSSDIHSTTIN